MSTASKKSTSTLQQKIEAANKRIRETDHRKNLLEARARGAKAGMKAARKAFKFAKKAARKAAKAAKRAHKELRALVKQANQKPTNAKTILKAKAKSPATSARKRPARRVIKITRAIDPAPQHVIVPMSSTTHTLEPASLEPKDPVTPV